MCSRKAPWHPLPANVRGPCQILFACIVLACSACSDNPNAAEAPLPESSDNDVHEQNVLKIETHQGTVLGSWADQSQKIRAFRGLPYAKPPTGELRWQPPQPADNWSQVRSASEPGAACWQAINSESFVWSRGEFPRSEDCLYLNIWSANNAVDQAVMVWFHGGAHTVGMADARC